MSRFIVKNCAMPQSRPFHPGTYNSLANEPNIAKFTAEIPHCEYF